MRILALVLGVDMLLDLGCYEVVAVGELIVAVLNGIVLCGELLGGVGLGVGDAGLDLCCEGLELHDIAGNGLIAAAAVVCGEELADAAVVIGLCCLGDGVYGLVDLLEIVVVKLYIVLSGICLIGCQLSKLRFGSIAEIIIPGVAFVLIRVLVRIHGALLLVERLGGVKSQKGDVVAVGVHKADVLHMIYIVALCHGKAAVACGDGRAVLEGDLGVLHRQTVKRSVQRAGVEVDGKAEEDDDGNAHDDPSDLLLFLLGSFLLRIDVLGVGALAASGLPVFSFG